MTAHRITYTEERAVIAGTLLATTASCSCGAWEDREEANLERSAVVDAAVVASAEAHVATMALLSRRRVGRLTTTELLELVEAGEQEAATEEELELAGAAEDELEQREYASSDDARVREGTGNYRGE